MPDDLCPGCPYKEKCMEENGPEREDGDDYRAVEGTHLCRRSWDQFAGNRFGKEGYKP
jgi:hypothetical protein